MDNDKLREILDRVDKQESQVNINRRACPRHKYRKHPLKVRITQPGGGVVQVAVIGHDISATGMSIVYRGFLYAGTELRITLPRRAGGEVWLEGYVAWCKHILGPHHLIGVKFCTRVYPRVFVETDTATAEEELATIDPSQIKGAVLLIDDQELDRMLFAHLASKTRLKVTPVANAVSALAAVSQQTFDAILCDLNLGESNGEDLLKQLRQAGCKCPLLALTAETAPARHASAVTAGACAVIQKPYDPNGLLSVLSNIFANGTPQAGAAIHSDLAGNPSIDPLITHCIEKVRVLATELDAAMINDDFTRVRAHSQTLKANGSGFGFPELSDAAKLVVASLDASMSIEETKDELHQLQSICRRLAPGKAPPASK